MKTFQNVNFHFSKSFAQLRKLKKFAKGTVNKGHKYMFITKKFEPKYFYYSYLVVSDIYFVNLKPHNFGDFLYERSLITYAFELSKTFCLCWMEESWNTVIET